MLVLKHKSIAEAIVAHAIIVCSCVENVNMVVVYFEGAYEKWGRKLGCEGLWIS